MRPCWSTRIGSPSRASGNAGSRTTEGPRPYISQAAATPTGSMVSRSVSRSIAGAVPSLTHSSSVLLEELDPRAAPISRAVPARQTLYWGWCWSMIWPVFSSTPPQKLTGSVSLSSGPDVAWPRMSSPAISRPPSAMTAAQGDLAGHGAFDAVGLAGGEGGAAEHRWRVVGPLGRVRHDHRARVDDVRLEVGAGVADDRYPGCFQALSCCAV